MHKFINIYGVAANKAAKMKRPYTRVKPHAYFSNGV
jgi:hypothetical protein